MRQPCYMTRKRPHLPCRSQLLPAADYLVIFRILSYKLKLQLIHKPYQARRTSGFHAKTMLKGHNFQHIPLFCGAKDLQEPKPCTFSLPMLQPFALLVITKRQRARGELPTRRAAEARCRLQGCCPSWHSKGPGAEERGSNTTLARWDI